MIKPDPNRVIDELKSDVKRLKEDLKKEQKLTVSMKKDLNILKIELKRLNTRMISNENDIGHLRSKR